MNVPNRVLIKLRGIFAVPIGADADVLIACRVFLFCLVFTVKSWFVCNAAYYKVLDCCGIYLEK